MSDYPKWCPYMSYVWTKKELQAWAKAVGGCALYDGRLWQADYKEVAPDMYNVHFKLQEPRYA